MALMHQRACVSAALQGGASRVPRPGLAICRLCVDAGARSCIGRVYAMQQMQLTMIALMAALRFELPAPADRAAHPAVRISTGITLKSDTGVWLSVSARR